MVTFRPAERSEDERLARIIHQAFRHAWEANWYSVLSALPRSIDFDAASQSSSSSTRATVDGGKLPTGTELARLNLYRATLQLTHGIGGNVDVAIPDDSLDTPAAVSPWFPPHIRPSLWSEYRYGAISAVLGLGFLGVYRIQCFESNTKRLWVEPLARLGLRHDECAYVWIVVTDPEHAGHGSARKLLEWRIQRHKELLPHVPVLLETSTGYAVKIYERLGFKVVAERRLEVDVDEWGLAVSSASGPVGEEKKKAWKDAHVVRAMVLDLRGEE